MGRQRWDSRTVFLLAAIGSAIGLGNVWRFPYLAGKYGGGAFLVPYLIALFLVGVPLLMLEFAVGQKMQQGAVQAFRKIKSGFGGLGVFALLSSFILVSYYAVVMAWSLLYFFASFGVKWADDSKGYFFNNILQISEGAGTVGGMNWPIFLALIAVWVMVYFCVWKGTKSVGKIVMWTVPLPIIFLIILLVKAFTLPGFTDGWALYLTPVWSALLDAEVWTAAFGQIFFTIGLAFGVMIAYSSYKDPKSDIAKNSWITALVNSGVSLLSGFVVFGILGYMATTTGTPLTDLAASGPGLAFVVFPEALSLMPLASLFSAVFFLMLLTLGIDSAFSLVEAVNAGVHDKKNKWPLEKVSLVVCGAALLAGIIYATQAGLYFLDIVDHFLTSYNLLIIGIVQSVLIGWVYGAKKLRKYISDVSDWKVGKLWEFSVKWLSPVVLTILLILQFRADLITPYEGYPAWALSIGWSIVIVPFLIFVFYLVKDRAKA